MRIRHSLTLALAGLLLPAMALAQERQSSAGKAGWLGIRCNITVTSDNTRTTVTVRVGEVLPGSPAEQSGLRPGDRILRVDGQSLDQGCNDLGRAIEVGDRVTLSVRSGERDREVTIVAVERPAAYGWAPAVGSIRDQVWVDGDSVRRVMRVWMDSLRLRIDSLPGDTDFIFQPLGPGAFAGRIRIDSLGRAFPFGDSIFERRLRIEGAPSIAHFEFLGQRSVAGAEFTEVNAGLAQYFGTNRGLLVVAVSPGTPAARAGIEAGDVLTGVNGQPMNSVDDFRHAVQRRGNQTLRLDIVRKQKPLTLEFDGRPARR